MSLASVMAPVEARNRQIVMADCWGHLFPEPGMYEGLLRVVRGAYGEVVLLDELIDVPGSPWWHSNVMGFISDLKDLKEGCVYELEIQLHVTTETIALYEEEDLEPGEENEYELRGDMRIEQMTINKIVNNFEQPTNN